MSPHSISVSVPAKINVQLSVGPLRPDGFHDLATVFHAVDLVDTLIASEAKGLSISVTGEGAQFVPTDSRNLVAKAAHLLAHMHGIAADVAFNVDKRIPVAGGMAGGSADAAAALLACDLLWQLGTSKGDLYALAAQLGSDVPFALHGGTSIGLGRGELLTPVMTTGEFHWVIALIDGGLSTPKVYAECDRLRAELNAPILAPEISVELLQALRAGDPNLLARELHNDLQEAAISLKPFLRRVLDTGMELGALAGIVSGSGPTCVFLTQSRDHAVSLAASMAGSGVCRTVRTAQGPAAGARQN
jgi:4-diphosphocytidyl-2-C-methyl-D-erythritol kinase